MKESNSKGTYALASAEPAVQISHLAGLLAADRRAVKPVKHWEQAVKDLAEDMGVDWREVLALSMEM